jgi:ABC-type multidrug transport system fused ATPase/permease subunit
MEEFPRLLFLVLRIALYFYIATSILNNTGSTFSDFAIFVTIITFTEKVLNEFLRTIRNITRNFSTVELLWSTFDSLTPIKGYSTGLPFSPQKKDINIDSISYGYNETKVFSGFSLTIKRGQKTALVGASGGGKTTLMKLIAGYLHPESGSISVLGNQLDETALRTYYPHIGYLTQDPGVFDATIRENLVSAVSSVPVSVMSTESSVSVTTTRHPAGKSTRARFLDSAIAPLEMTETQKQKDNLEQKLIKALKLAHCDFVFELEHGLDTEIGERGVRLS